MDILIPLGHGSRWQNNELRYCLRSVEQNFSGVDNVYIIGQKPDWIQNVNHIAVEDIRDGKFRDYNIYLKIVAGCRTAELSEDFLYMSDDHFILQEYLIREFPYYYRGNLEDKIASFSEYVPYVNVLKNTYYYLDKNLFPTKDYQVHCPVIYNKGEFIKLFPSPWPEYGFALKSIYCNQALIDNSKDIFIPDCKISIRQDRAGLLKAIENRPFFSIGNRALDNTMKALLEELFPNKSKYEI